MINDMINDFHVNMELDKDVTTFKEMSIIEQNMELDKDVTTFKKCQKLSKIWSLIRMLQLLKKCQKLSKIWSLIPCFDFKKLFAFWLVHLALKNGRDLIFPKFCNYQGTLSRNANSTF